MQVKLEHQLFVMLSFSSRASNIKFWIEFTHTELVPHSTFNKSLPPFFPLGCYNKFYCQIFEDL